MESGPTDNNKLGMENRKEFAEDIKYSYIVELRDRNDREQLLPVVATGVNIEVREEFAHLELYYVFVNNGAKRKVNLEVHKIEGSHSGEVKIFRNPSSDHEIVASKTITDGFYETSETYLATVHTKIELKEDIDANDFWRVVYSFYMPVTSSIDGKTLSFTLPSSAYQVSYDEETFKSFSDKIGYSKFKELKGYYLAPYQVKVKEISSQYTINNMQITSMHKDSVELSTKGCSTPVNATLFPCLEDFTFQWGRELPTPDEPVSVLEFNDQDSNYYLYLKAFPRNAIADILEEFCENLDKPLTPSRDYKFTIVMDTGSSVLSYENQVMVKQAAKEVLSKLMTFPDQEFISFRIFSTNQEDVPVEEFSQMSEETITSAKENVDKFTFSDYNTDFATSLTSIREHFSQEGGVDEREAHRYIFISSATTASKSLFNDMTDLINTNGQIRFYYVSVEPKIDYDLKKYIRQNGTGLAVTVKDNFDLEDKIESVVTHALRPFNYKIEIGFEGFKIEPVNNNYLVKIRDAYESIEFLGFFPTMNCVLPDRICLSITFDCCEGAQISFSKNIVIEKHKVKEDYFLQKIAKDILSYEQIPKPKFDAGAANIVQEGGIAVIQFEINYGNTRQTLKFPGSTSMELVRNEIVAKLNVKNKDYSTWRTEDGVPIDFTKNLDQFKGDEIGKIINIPLPKTTAVDVADLHKALVKKIDGTGLFVFDGKFLINDMQVSQDDWNNFEKKTLTKDLCQKLFKIQSGISKDNRNIVFSYYCLFFLRNYFEENICEVEEQMEKAKKSLASKVGYSEALQKDFDALVTFTPEMFK